MNEYNSEYHYSQPSKPFPEKPVNEYNSDYHYNQPSKPFVEKPLEENYNSKPVSLSLIYEIENTGNHAQSDTLYQDPPKKLNGYGPNNHVVNKDKHPPHNYKEFSSKPIVTHSTGHKGEHITSIITEIRDRGKWYYSVADFNTDKNVD